MSAGRSPGRPGVGYGAGVGLAVNGANLDNTLITGLLGGQVVFGDTAAGGTLDLVSTAHATKGVTTLGKGGASEVAVDEPNQITYFGKRSIYTAAATSRFVGDDAGGGTDYWHLLGGKAGGGIKPILHLGNRGGSGGDDILLTFSPAGGGLTGATNTAIKCKYDVASSSYRFYLSPGNGSNVAQDVIICDGRYNVALGKPSAATTATDGFPYVTSCAGAPTGVPTNFVAGTVPIVIDTTNSKFWAYIGGAWKGALLV